MRLPILSHTVRIWCNTAILYWHCGLIKVLFFVESWLVVIGTLTLIIITTFLFPTRFFHRSNEECERRKFRMNTKRYPPIHSNKKAQLNSEIGFELIPWRKLLQAQEDESEWNGPIWQDSDGSCLLLDIIYLWGSSKLRQIQTVGPTG